MIERDVELFLHWIKYPADPFLTEGQKTRACLSWAASLSSVIIIGLCRCTEYVPQADTNAERGSDWPISAGVSSNDRSGAPRAGETPSFDNGASGSR